MLNRKRFRVMIVLPLLLGGLMLAVPGVAYPADQPSIAEVENRTAELKRLAQALRHTPVGRQQPQIDLLVKVAAERRRLMARLMEENPRAVPGLVLSTALRDQLPPQVAPLVERRVEKSGMIEVVYQDYPDRHELRHLLKDERGRRIELFPAPDAPRLQTGDRIRAGGVLVPALADEGGTLEGWLAVDDGEQSLQLLAADGPGTGSLDGSGPVPLEHTLGEQKTLVLLVNFQDLTQQPWTVSEADGLIFGNIDAYYRENSFGRTWLGGDSFGWFTLAIDSTSDAMVIADAADAAAAAAGIDLSAYQRYVYLFPKVSGYGWSGMGTVGGQPSRAWINGTLDQRVVAHELGHNLGLYHAHGLECGELSLADNCTNVGYGDSLDLMGSRQAHLNGFNKLRLGWLDAGEVITVRNDGDFALEAYAQSSVSGARVLRILKEQDPVGGASTWFYIEYRQPIGADSFLEGDANVTEGVVVRIASDANPDSSYLLDMTPASSTYYDWYDPALTFGSRFTDPASGLAITPLSGDGSRAWVRLSLSTTQTADCSRAAPSVTVADPATQYVAAGSPATYLLTVTNNDGPACGGSTFDLGAALPEGWGGTFSNPVITLDPGAAASSGLEVISPLNSEDGFNDIAVDAVNREAPAYAGSEVVTYVVDGGTQDPVALDDAALTVQETPVTIAVLANDSDPAGGMLTLLEATQGGAGMVTVNGDGTLTYTPRRRFKGTDLFTYTVSNGAGTASATVTVSVQREANGGGGGGTKGGGGGKGKKS